MASAYNPEEILGGKFCKKLLENVNISELFKDKRVAL